MKRTKAQLEHLHREQLARVGDLPEVSRRGLLSSLGPMRAYLCDSCGSSKDLSGPSLDGHWLCRGCLAKGVVRAAELAAERAAKETTT